MRSLELTKEFMKAAAQPLPDNVNLNDEVLNRFRFSLIEEEHSELKHSQWANDQTGVLDALTDLIIVTDGAALAFGISEEYEETCFEMQFTEDETDLDYAVKNISECNIERIYKDDAANKLSALRLAIEYYAEALNLGSFLNAALEEVHHSNMSKFDRTTKDMEATRNHYAKQGITTEARYLGEFGHWVTYRASDMKVLKSVNNYREPNLAAILEGKGVTL